MINVFLNIDVENGRVDITNVGHANEDGNKEKNDKTCNTISNLMDFLYFYQCKRIYGENRKAILELGLTHLKFDNIKDDESEIFWGLKDYLLFLEKQYNSISVNVKEGNFDKE